MAGYTNKVSMKSGLEGRNNPSSTASTNAVSRGLNEVRPRRPEQFVVNLGYSDAGAVSQ